MTINRVRLKTGARSVLLAATILAVLSAADWASAQSLRRIEPGTTIDVRTNENINANRSDGRVYSGSVEHNVLNREGGIAIPRGSEVELLVKSISPEEVALDLEAVVINGERYGIQSDDSVVTSDRDDGFGANKRTGTFIGGGAAIGAIIGAIAGGGKGAAIGGGLGAAAGATMMTRGRTVDIPPESLVTFRLERPLQTGVSDRGFNRNGQHYHPGYGTDEGDSPAYQDGMQAGRSDADRNLARNMQSNRWTRGPELREYQDGYNAGYGQQAPVNAPTQSFSIRIGSDHNIHWQGPPNAKVYVQVDNNPRQLFAAGTFGTQMASWIVPGHLYVFFLQDANGKEVARAQSDLRLR